MVPEIAVQLVDELKGNMPICEICKHLGIPRSVYYRWKKNLQNERATHVIERKIGELCRGAKFRYGYRKITALLNQEIHVNHKVVQRVMKKYG